MKNFLLFSSFYHRLNFFLISNQKNITLVHIIYNIIIYSLNNIYSHNNLITEKVFKEKNYLLLFIKNQVIY